MNADMWKKRGNGNIRRMIPGLVRLKANPGNPIPATLVHAMILYTPLAISIGAGKTLQQRRPLPTRLPPSPVLWKTAYYATAGAPLFLNFLWRELSRLLATGSFLLKA